MLAVALAAIVALVAVLHRNSGDVGAAADLVDARAEIAARTGEGEDPFAAVDRGTFAATTVLGRAELGPATPPHLASVALGSYTGNDTAAIQLLLDTAIDTAPAGEVVHLTLSTGGNGLEVRWPAGDASSASITDLRSGAAFAEPAVRAVGRTVTIALPSAFRPGLPWTVTAAPG